MLVDMVHMVLCHILSLDGVSCQPWWRRSSGQTTHVVILSKTDQPLHHVITSGLVNDSSITEPFNEHTKQRLHVDNRFILVD